MQRFRKSRGNNNIVKYTFVKDYLFLKKHGENL